MALRMLCASGSVPPQEDVLLRRLCASGAVPQDVVCLRRVCALRRFCGSQNVVRPQDGVHLRRVCALRRSLWLSGCCAPSGGCVPSGGPMALRMVCASGGCVPSGGSVALGMLCALRMVCASGECMLSEGCVLSGCCVPLRRVCALRAVPQEGVPLRRCVPALSRRGPAPSVPSHQELQIPEPSPSRVTNRRAADWEGSLLMAEVPSLQPLRDLPLSWGKSRQQSRVLLST